MNLETLRNKILENIRDKILENIRDKVPSSPFLRFSRTLIGVGREGQEGKRWRQTGKYRDLQEIHRFRVKYSNTQGNTGI